MPVKLCRLRETLVSITSKLTIQTGDNSLPKEWAPGESDAVCEKDLEGGNPPDKHGGLVNGDDHISAGRRGANLADFQGRSRKPGFAQPAGGNVSAAGQVQRRADLVATARGC